MLIIDAHAHIYPEKIAQKATEAIGSFYNIKMEMPSGTAERLVSLGEKAGISRYVVHSCATKPEQVKAINDFIKAEMDKFPQFIGFMTLHEDLTEEEIYNEIKRCMAQGFKGIKLHPDFQKFYIDGENADKIYRVLSEFGKNFPILFHTGDNRYEYSKPYRLKNVAKKYKNLNFIGAHFGGYRCWDDVEVYKGLDNVRFDTSSSLPFISSEKATNIIYMLGVEKFFFGTDFPMWDAETELKRFDRLKITDDEKENILGKNILNFIKI